MVVLSRQAGESIVIGQTPEQWIVTVHGISGDKVRVGIASPVGSTLHTSPRSVELSQDVKAIQISQDILAAIVDICGDKVRIAVQAPKTCSVHRLEVFEAIQRKRGGSE
jgi:carbon storage regulator CsrA